MINLINEKIDQAMTICRECGVDMWMTFVRESSSNSDPMLEVILGTNCTWTSALIITAQGEAIAIVGSLDSQNIKDHAKYKVIGYVDSIKNDLLDTLSRLNPGKIAINYSISDVMADGLSHGMYLTLIDYLRETPYAERLISSEEIVAALRGRKSKIERDKIKASIKETCAIFEQVSKFVHVGLTEQDVARFILEQVKSRGLDLAWDEAHCPAVFSGPNTAGAHAGPTVRKIEPGHIMNIDFGVKKEGYVSDLQRTWYFKRPDEKEVPEAVQKGFDTIYNAIQKAAAAIKPGLEGWQIDDVARQYIVDAGYEEFPHGLGHQVGRQAHDGAALLCPRWDRYKNLPYLKIEQGQVYTLEPRLTVEGYGIATIEEIIVVTKDGCEFLSPPQKELYVISDE